MIWLTWRQFRTQAAAAAAIAVAFALVLAATGPRLVDIAATYRDVFGLTMRTSLKQSLETGPVLLASPL